MTHPLAPMGDPALQGLSARQAVILTALPVEYQAVRAHLTHLQAATHPRGTLYERGQFRTPRQVWEGAIAQLGVGNSGTAQEAAVLGKCQNWAHIMSSKSSKCFSVASTGLLPMLMPLAAGFAEHPSAAEIASVAPPGPLFRAAWFECGSSPAAHHMLDRTVLLTRSSRTPSWGSSAA